MFHTENMGFCAAGCGPANEILVSCMNRECRVFDALHLIGINWWDGR